MVDVLLQLEALREQYEEQVSNLKEELQHERTARLDGTGSVSGADTEGETEVSPGETSLFVQVWPTHFLCIMHLPYVI